MSDAEVLREIERMEAWMGAPELMPGPDGLAEWNRAFRIALADAERGPGWSDLVLRSKALGSKVEGQAAIMAAERSRIRVELDSQELGGRALKGYGAAAR